MSSFIRNIQSIDRFDRTTSLTVDNQNSTVLQYRGNWGNATDPQVPDEEHPAPFYATTSSGAAVSLNFTGAVALAVNASTNYGHGLYNVVSPRVGPVHEFLSSPARRL